jgi:hypothetical protein
MRERGAGVPEQRIYESSVGSIITPVETEKHNNEYQLERENCEKMLSTPPGIGVTQSSFRRPRHDGN